MRDSDDDIIEPERRPRRAHPAEPLPREVYFVGLAGWYFGEVEVRRYKREGQDVEAG